MKQHIKPKLIK